MSIKLQSPGGCQCGIACTIAGVTHIYPTTLNLTQDAVNTTFAVTLPATVVYNPATGFWESAWFSISGAALTCTWMQIRAQCADFFRTAGNTLTGINRFGVASGVVSGCTQPLSVGTVVSGVASPLNLKAKAVPGGTGGNGPPKLTYIISQ